MNAKTLYSILLACSFLGFTQKSKAQLYSNFIAPSAGCLNERLEIQNTSSQATRYVWDFCNNDLQSSPSAISVCTLPASGSFYYNSIKLISDQGVNLAFATDAAGLKLIRLYFGANWTSIPAITDLGNPGGLFTSPGAIESIKENGIWYFFVANTYQNRIVRITMGNGLLSPPTATEDLLDLGTGLLTPMAIKAVLSGTSHLLLVSGQSSQSISVIDFSSSFAASPISSHNLTDPLIVSPSGVDVISDGIIWYGLVGGAGVGNAVLLNFGTDLNNIPTFSDLGIVVNTREVKLVKEGLSFIGFLRSENDGVYRIQFGSDFSSPSSFSKVASNALQFTSRSLDVIKDTPTWKLFTIEATTGNVLRLDFSGNCQAQVSINYSTQISPTNISYSQAGNYSIELTAFDNNNVSSVSNAVINVSSFNAPDIDFSSQNICSNNDVNFTSINQSGGITSYSWNFGDGGSSSSSTPAYIFSSAGNYNVMLTVTDGNNCQNTAQKPIQIFNPPQANFYLPSANPFCTGQNYAFANASTSDPGSNPAWQWSVNGTNVSTTQDLNYLFSSNSDQTIELTASIPGCSTQATHTVASIQNGPLLSFTSPATSCVGTSVSFTNTSSGSVLGYNWTFGDGNSSLQTSPSNAFASNGSYNVTLSASNAAGCQNSFSQPITIYTNPQPDFSIDLPPFSCAGSPSQFNDFTPALTDSNLSGWSWQFGDAAIGSSSQRNPAYTYSTAADYNVTLQVTSNFGCSGTKQKTITISPSPQAIFTTSAACVNQSTQFTDASTGGVKSRQWKIQNSIFSSPTPTYTFLSSATYPVTLAVTGNNNCINQITQNVIVPVAPVMDFSVLYPCTGSSAQFQEVNPGGADPATAWNWNFSPGSGSGNPASNSFSSAAVYPVTLTSTRQSKCIYSITKKVSIINGPVASFTPSVSAGAAPLNVLFTNNSSFADSYSWSFADANNSTSTDTSPSFVFTQLGTYQVQLTASNALNCSNTVSAAVSVVIPSIDAIMSSLVLAEDPQTLSTRPIVTIINNSNVPLVDPLVIIDLGGDASLKEKISGTIQAGGSITRTLDFQILPKSIAYICAQVDVFNDVFSANDQQCVSLSQDEIVLSPYPNPATTQMNIRWINAKAERVHVMIFKPNGQVAFDEEVDSPAGLSDFKLDTSLWGSGLYLVRITGGTSEKIYKVVIIN